MSRDPLLLSCIPTSVKVNSFSNIVIDETNIVALLSLFYMFLDLLLFEN
jgi:hypothetical protein